MYGNYLQQSMGQPGKVVRISRGQLNKKHFFVSVGA